MSLREQARRVADATEAITFCRPCDIADEVSDVWEPIARDLLSMVTTVLHCYDNDNMVELNIETIRRRVREHQEALG